MSASKNRDINLHHSNEKQSLWRFLSLYIFLVIVLVSLLSTFYYQSQEQLMFSNMRTKLSEYANIQVKNLKILQHYFPAKSQYPRDERFQSAIYDIERVFIFSTLTNNNIDFDKEIYRVGDKIHFVKYLDDYYLGTKYLFIEVDEDRAWYHDTLLQIMAIGTVALLILGIFGFFFMRIFLRPMRNSIELLDNFIKDTTHELNTPISAILANIEMMDTEIMAEKNVKKLRRINVAAKTVSHLYQDLTYLVLGNKNPTRDEWLDLKELITSRVEYFSLLAESKRIEIEMDLEACKVWIDCAKIARVVDNLISNAIKYNKRSGKIKIILRKDYFLVADTGIGIEQDQVDAMFDRYSRFSSSEGGFGIGLNIVKSILDEYHFDVTVNSIVRQGTTIKIIFPKGGRYD